MTKKQFIQRLENELIENNVKNIKEILIEYGNHFEEGKIVGKSEEEICESLGSPEMIASEYTNKEEKELDMKKTAKSFEKIVLAVVCSVVLIVSLIVLVPLISRTLDDRVITITYDQNEVSLMSVKEDNINDFRFLGKEVKVNKGDEFYIAIEQKTGYEVKTIKINGIDKTSDLLSSKDRESLNNLPANIKNLILSNDDSVFIKINVTGDINIEIISD